MVCIPRNESHIGNQMYNLIILTTTIIILSFPTAGYVQGAEGSVYSTWETMEPDKCASAWLIKRFIDKDAVFRFSPKGETIKQGIPFDVPEAEIRRYHNMAAFGYLMRKHRITDPALREIGKIIHDIEINYWGRKTSEASQRISDAIREIAKSSETPAEALRRSFPIFDELYSTFGQTKWEKGEIQ